MRCVFFAIILFYSCNHKSDQTKINSVTGNSSDSIYFSTESMEKRDSILAFDPSNFNDSTFVDLARLSDDFIFDLKYATSDNFLNEPVYECPTCFLRYSIAKKLVMANEYFLSKGYKIKLFDCYRPLSVQKQMWEIMPDARYVANPNTSMGSYHNRGGAVDLTLVDSQGNEVDMGTPFDFFGEESHFDNKSLPPVIIARRVFLRQGMELAGFNGIRTEWWHFSTDNFRVSDQILCP